MFLAGARRSPGAGRRVFRYEAHAGAREEGEGGSDGAAAGAAGESGRQRDDTTALRPGSFFLLLDLPIQ
jgi:hypothetical protein